LHALPVSSGGETLRARSRVGRTGAGKPLEPPASDAAIELSIVFWAPSGSDTAACGTRAPYVEEKGTDVVSDGLTPPESPPGSAGTEEYSGTGGRAAANVLTFAATLGLCGVIIEPCGCISWDAFAGNSAGPTPSGGSPRAT